MMKKKQKLFNKKSLALIIIGIVINLMGSSIAEYYKLPLFMDSAGTFLVSMLAGPAAGVVAGTVMNFMTAAPLSYDWLYMFVSIGGAVTVGKLLYKKERMDSFLIVGTGVLTGIVMTIISTPINMILNGGMTGNIWSDALVELMSQYTSLTLVCCICGEIIVNIPDKMITIILIAYAVLLFRHMGLKLEMGDDEENEGHGSVKDGASLIVSAFILSAALSLSLSRMAVSAAEDFDSDYALTVYGLYEGLNSSQINSVTQTGDGYIWAGSYSGLYRYDGMKFEQVNLDKRICNAMILYADTRGRLWIGTNDSGLACYDPDKETIRFFDRENGMSADSIRDICEDEKGNIYVSTVSYINKINLSNSEGPYISVYDANEDITSVYSLIYLGDDRICGVTGKGMLFAMKDGELLFTKKCGREEYQFSAVAYDGNEHLLAGSTGDYMESLTLGESGFLLRSISTGAGIAGLSGFNRLGYSEDYKGFFASCVNGFGFISNTGKAQNLSTDDFNTAAEDVFIDRQKNIWFCSSKQGIVKLSKNPFSDLFKHIGEGEKAVNATCIVDDDLYIGTDNGAMKVNVTTEKKIKDERLDVLEGERIRSISRDSGGNLWFSTYGENGLVRIGQNGDIRAFTHVKDSSVLGTRFRFAMELEDGRIFAASTEGINYIADGRVVKTISEADGMEVPKVLSAIQDADGCIWAGTDGGGVYMIKDDAVEAHFGKGEGLMSEVVMKVVPCEGGRLYVTSNGLYLHSGDGIKKLENFPYNNVYDVYISDDHTAFVTSSAGLYVTLEDDLLKDEEGYTYSLLNGRRGLETSFTANSWSSEKNEKLYLCCTEGVRVLGIRDYEQFDNHYQIAVRSLTKDGVEVPLENGVYDIPAGPGKVVINPALLNYTVSDPLVRVTLEGAGDEGNVMRQSAMEPIYYSSINPGDYSLVIEVLDGSGEKVLKSMTYLIHKDAKLYEQGYFKIYIICVLSIMLVFIVWLVSRMGNMAVINSQYDQIKQAKDEAEYANETKTRFLAQMSHEIRTPISAVLGMDEMILQESREPDTRSYAADIYDAGNTLLELINDILDSSRLEAGGVELIMKEYELAGIVKDVMSMSSQRARLKDLKIEAEIDPELPRGLKGDELRIRQIIMNLMSNAVKYTISGTVWLRISGIKDGAKAVLHVEVEDTGVGIKEEDLPLLFEEYKRIEEGSIKNTEGTGLGMSITVGLLKMMGSSLQVSSIYGKGSRFYFDLEQEITDDAPIGEFSRLSGRNEGEDEEEEEFTAADARVLIVDDNALNRKVFRNLLKRTRVKVSEAASGYEALVMADTEHYDMIFMDHMMPGMDGIETLNKLNEMDGLKETPVYVLTANTKPGIKAEHADYGFSGFISKPVTANDLRRALKEGLPAELIHPLTEEEKELYGVGRKNDIPPLPDDLPSVEGLDWAHAWLHLPDRDMLRNAVKAFYDVTDVQADRLQEFYRVLVTHAGNMEVAKIAPELNNEAGRGEDPIKAYGIQAGIMKTSADALGIISLAGMAEILESAAASENTATIRAVHETFIREWKSWREKLKGVFGVGTRN
ncbi:MAG: response regulator [Lachnospiraceae bacterium]|nr:response regulator [Lachnospiraceae bacterium]